MNLAREHPDPANGLIVLLEAGPLYVQQVPKAAHIVMGRAILRYDLIEGARHHGADFDRALYRSALA